MYRISIKYLSLPSCDMNFKICVSLWWLFVVIENLIDLNIPLHYWYNSQHAWYTFKIFLDQCLHGVMFIPVDLHQTLISIDWWIHSCLNRFLCKGKGLMTIILHLVSFACISCTTILILTKNSHKSNLPKLFYSEITAKTHHFRQRLF